ncbi:hypothetical protein J4Q44_G00139350 [Coregonus suidteri]|uniref:Uncharacterized protein n=1 Tax=Coregonus suidteri TaxID=861788 RepID=A0AAN8MFI0_9TELE
MSSNFKEVGIRSAQQKISQAEKLPLEEPLIKHAQFVDVWQRAESDIEDVLYFVERFPHLLPYHGPEEHDLLDAERVFSVVGLNKTKRRNSLALDGILSSIMTIKMGNLEPCFKWEPPSDIIKASKKATGQYNHADRS